MATPLLRYLRNGFELVELMAGCVSGTHGTHAHGSGMRISAARCTFARVSFIVKRMSITAVPEPVRGGVRTHGTSAPAGRRCERDAHRCHRGPRGASVRRATASGKREEHSSAPRWPAVWWLVPVVWAHFGTCRGQGVTWAAGGVQLPKGPRVACLF